MSSPPPFRLLYSLQSRIGLTATSIGLAALAAIPGESTPRDRAIAATLVLCATVVAGAVWGYRIGFGVSLIMAGYLSALSAARLPGQDTFPSLPVTYVFVMAAGAGLAAFAASKLDDARRVSSILATELEQSKRQRAVVECISSIGRELSSNPADSDAVRSGLATLTSLLDIDVFIVRRNTDTEQGLSSTIESWITTEGADRELAKNDGVLEWRRLPNMHICLEAGEAFGFSSFDELPIPDRVTLSDGIARLESVINIPVMDDGAWRGHVALGTKRAGKRWASEEIASLSILADMIAGAWRRERQTLELMGVIEDRGRAITAQNALTEGTRLLLAHDLDEPLGETLSLVMDALHGEAAYIEMIEEDPDRGLVSRPIEHLFRDPSRKTESVTWPLSWSPVAAHKLLSGQPSIFESAEEEAASDPDRIEPYEQAPLAAECNYPIVIEGATVGFVGVGTFEPRHWTDIDKTVMHSFALMLGAYFEREAAMRQLEDLVAAKDRFIASVSHELRTPLAVVVGLAAELEDNDDAFTREERAEFLGMMRRQSTEVSDIIDDLLVSTRIAETELTIMESEFALDDLIRDVLRDLPADISEKVVDADLSPVQVLADPLRTRQIVRNLITNAHRYGGPNVHVTVRSTDRLGILEVADDGAGVAKERRDEIFEAYQTSGGERIVTAAIGLGLTVSRQLARLMRGNVTYVHGDLPRFELELQAVRSREPATQTRPGRAE